MDFSHSIRIAAPAEVVFALYADVARWPNWDSEVRAVDLPGLVPGAVGYLKPRSGPKARIRVTEVTPNRSFTVESALPLFWMQFGHTLSEAGGLTTATHSLRFSGPLAFLFRRLIGAGIHRTLPATLQGLKAAAERRG